MAKKDNTNLIIGLVAVGLLVVVVALYLSKHHSNGGGSGDGGDGGGCCVPMKDDSDPEDKDVCNKVKDENKCGTDATTINCKWKTKNCV